MDIRTIQRLAFGIICSLQGAAFAESTEIFVRLNSDPFAAPYYIFSHTENGDSITPELVRGSTYVFTRTDSGHPFNIGAGWRSADNSLAISSTGTDYVVSDNASIENGQKLTVQIPSDFSGSTITYYCYLHSSMVSTISVVDPAPVDPDTLDTDSDGIPDVNDADDDGDGVIDSLDPWPLDDYYSSDYDSDGMPDLFENFHGLDAASDDSSTDTDLDGLTNLEEFTYGTDPQNHDTDFDSISDGVEIRFSRDPLVADFDFIADSSGFCSISDAGASCYPEEPEGGITGMREFSGNYQNFCAIRNDDIICIRDNKVVSETPLSNPHSLSHIPYSGNTWCAIDDSGVVCNNVQKFQNLDQTIYNHPIKVSHSSSGTALTVCAIFTGPNLYRKLGKTSELQCEYGSEGLGEDLAAPTGDGISEPKDIKIFDEMGAIISRTKIVLFGKTCRNAPYASSCTEPNWTDEQLDALNRPRQVAVGDDHFCVEHSDGIFCGRTYAKDYWGQIALPQVGSVHRLKAGRDLTCVFSEEGLFCKGRDTTDSAGTNSFGIAKWYRPQTINWTNPPQTGYSFSTFPSDVESYNANTDSVLDANPDVLVPYLDIDKDGYRDSVDVFPLDATEWLDTDGDLIGNNIDTDDDNDGFPDSTDNNPLDTDNDGIDNVTDDDDDGDGIKDTEDTYLLDTDNDAQHNGIDEDDDNDGYADEVDAFILDSSEWLDTDGDGIGNNADADDDNDGLSDSSDQFPLDSSEQVDSDGDGVGNNEDQMPFDANETLDTDSDGVGNNADTDDDGDGLSDETEATLGTDPLRTDSDSDGSADSLDAFPLDANETLDTDSDGVGNNADTDDDGDGVLDGNDNFPLDSSESIDTDSDGIGNNADSDDDGDGVLDGDDAFPLVGLNGRADSDRDGYPDRCDADCLDLGMLADADDDNDGVIDEEDQFPLDPLESMDSDSDGIGDNADSDDDGDSVLDGDDAFPLDSSESIDTDSDGIGNNADPDDDNDGFTDEEELADGTNPLSRFSCKSGCFSFDVDESLEAQPLTDGLLVIRHLFGFSGDSLTAGAVSGEASRGSSEAIGGYLTDADSQLDIDGDDESKPLTDGLLLIRYLFGFSGDSLVSGAIGTDATRNTAEAVEAYISERVPQ